MPNLEKFLKETSSEIVALGKKHGYTFTAADIERLATQTGELSDDELKDVAGGTSPGHKSVGELTLK